MMKNFATHNGTYLTYLKVRQLLGISANALERRIKNDESRLFTSEEIAEIDSKGFDGISLNRLVSYYAFDSVNVSEETQRRCQDILRQGSLQDFVEITAGVNVHEKEVTPPDVRLKDLMETLKFFGINPQNSDDGDYRELVESILLFP